MRNYKPATFQPTIRPDWAGVLSYLSDKEKSEILVALFKYPSVECKSAFWLETIKPDLDLQYSEFQRICAEKARGVRNRWGKTSITDVKTSNTNVIDSERERERKEESIDVCSGQKNQVDNQVENKARAHNMLEIVGNAFKATDAVVGIFDRPDGSQREGIQIKNPHLMAFVKHRFDKKTLEKVSDWAIDHNQRGHTYNATSLLKLLCKFQSNIEPSINFNHVQSEYLTFEQQR